MSYEGKMLDELEMPSRHQVEKAILISLFKHNGVIKEFGAGEEIVGQIADGFGLNERQKGAYLETIYRKQNRVKRSSLWHRLLFRAADSLANEKLVSRPTKTFQLTNKREWMLTEEGYDAALDILGLPREKKEVLPIKSYEVEKIVQKLNRQVRPLQYNPFDKGRRVATVTRDIKLRQRGFRQAVIEAYNFKCAVCGMKIFAPRNEQWEVEAAHIVPHSFNGRDDIWNGLALCRLHHWAFDVGWFTLKDDFRIFPSGHFHVLPSDMGKMGNCDLIQAVKNKNRRIFLPSREEIYPHETAIRWHRENVFFN